MDTNKESIISRYWLPTLCATAFLPLLVDLAVFLRLRRRWKHLAENGGVLVSPFISPEEKSFRRQCEQIKGKIILLSNTPFAESISIPQ